MNTGLVWRPTVLCLFGFLKPGYLGVSRRYSFIYEMFERGSSSEKVGRALRA